MSSDPSLRSLTTCQFTMFLVTHSLRSYSKVSFYSCEDCICDSSYEIDSENCMLLVSSVHVSKISHVDSFQRYHDVNFITIVIALQDAID